ncbi:MAG: P1 family peptidase [candidate division KSB1 bacterium]|nr:P1 family peptidase [candidate division KSB1 bacterium]MDZ7275357.1 P1 family peptidase [candidate division KSB1 bacterium]MDZ7286330.1 P1 family peptidase [candidate division KSB1 bacterium]MDZ7296557.1 P1 family peptidase [candidate division KSB1 bacterium]MDZ7306091.1 P1 family peptidase [candidate division KSB1 bacterium]
MIPSSTFSFRPISRRRFCRQIAGLALLTACSPPHHYLPATPPRRKRLRDLGIVIGTLPTGACNAITDVAGVQVGHCTRLAGAGALRVGQGPIRTGVTVIMPGRQVVVENVTAARFVMNGNGEMTGLGAVDQTGLLQTPIFLTDTSNVGRVMNGALTWLLQSYPEIGDTAPVPVPVVAETWAAFLHDAEGRHLEDEHVLAAIADARSGPVAEGAVGGGVGMVCFDFKGGIGTASRVLPATHGGYTFGVLVQANFGEREQLIINGVPVGREITDLMPVTSRKAKSLILIGATDAPMIPAQLQRLCKHMILGMARTGGQSGHSSGDLALFFSTGIQIRPGDAFTDIQIFNDEWLSRAHQAAGEAAEEAILNALCAAETTVGIDGNTAFALPLERLPAIMRKYGR